MSTPVKTAKLKAPAAHVVVVEDNVEANNLLRDWLKLKFTVTCFLNAESVLRVFPVDCREPLVFLIDYNMPGDNGMVLKKKLMTRFPQAKYILISASSTKSSPMRPSPPASTPFFPNLSACPPSRKRSRNSSASSRRKASSISSAARLARPRFSFSCSGGLRPPIGWRSKLASKKLRYPAAVRTTQAAASAFASRSASTCRTE